ncbi:hypothetical protein Y956_16647, partial [Nipponia nippon]
SSACAVFYKYASVLACVYVSVHRHVFSGKARRSLVCSSFVSNAPQSRKAVCTAWISAHRSPRAHLISYCKSQAASEASSNPKAKNCLCITSWAVTSPLRKIQFLTNWPEDSL